MRVDCWAGWEETALETLLGGPAGVVTDSGTQKPLNVPLEDGEWK